MENTPSESCIRFNQRFRCIATQIFLVSYSNDYFQYICLISVNLMSVFYIHVSQTNRYRLNENEIVLYSICLTRIIMCIVLYQIDFFISIFFWIYSWTARNWSLYWIHIIHGDGFTSVLLRLMTEKKTTKIVIVTLYFPNDTHIC